MLSFIKNLYEARFYGDMNLIWFIFTLAATYFTLLFIGKLFLSKWFYHPVKTGYTGQVDVVLPTYKEDSRVLNKAIELVLADPATMRLIIVTDEREPQTAAAMQYWTNMDPRVSVIVAPPGKRQAIAMGMNGTNSEVVVVVESDTYNTSGHGIAELIKPFANPKVGGVVGNQLIFEPWRNVASLFNNWAEIVKYALTVPALSVFGQVTVLGGRCVAYRRAAVMPLLPSLVGEKYFSKLCVSGDDGRMSSLLLQTGWKCVYQSSALFETVSPPNMDELIKQRLRWFRNSCRRTIRAIFCFGEPELKKANIKHSRFWAYTKPAAYINMLTTWTNSIAMGAVLFTMVYSFLYGEWFWFGSTPLGIAQRLSTIFLGIALTRIIRAYSVFGPTRKTMWIFIFLFPWYLIMMWGVRLFAIVTHNKQGWISRNGNGGAGGFNQDQKKLSGVATGTLIVLALLAASATFFYFV